MPHAERHHGLTGKLGSPSKLALIGLNLLVSSLLLRWVATNIRLETLVAYLSDISIWAILGSLIINLAALGLYGARMSVLLRRDFLVSFSVVNVGYALNSLIPLRLGEATKIYLCHRLYSIPMTALFSAAVAEKLFDLFNLLLLGGVLVAFAAGELIQISIILPITFPLILGVGFIALFQLYIVRLVRLLPKRGRLRGVSIEIA